MLSRLQDGSLINPPGQKAECRELFHGDLLLAIAVWNMQPGIADSRVQALCEGTGAPMQVLKRFAAIVFHKPKTRRMTLRLAK